MAGAPIDNKNARKWNLNDKQRRFCQEYVIDLKQGDAAKRAGYSEKTAYSIGNRLLKKVEIQEYLAYLKQKPAKKLEITHEMLTKEWAKMAFSSIAHLHNTWIELQEFEKLKRDNPDILDCIQEINTKVEKREIGDDIFAKVEFVRLKLYSKQVALENLGKHIGYYLEDNKQKQIPIKSITFE